MENRCSFRFFLEGVAVHVNIVKNKKEEYFVIKYSVWYVIWEMLLKSLIFYNERIFKISTLNIFFNQDAYFK